MNKQHFMKELNHLLSKIPEHDREEILYDYEEHFNLAIEEGKTEEEIVKDLGSPKTIARELLVDYRVTQAEADKSVKNISQAILATIGLSFFNLVFILGPVLAIIGVYIGLSGTAIALTLSPIAWLVSLFFETDYMIVTFFATLTLSSLGVLLSIAMIYVGKFLYDVILRYIKFNVRIIKGGNVS